MKPKRDPFAKNVMEGDGSICHCGEAIIVLSGSWVHGEESVDDLCDDAYPEEGQHGG